jgi:hypothetical protein
LPSEVTNCSVHNGYSWAVNMMGSANVNISNNVFFNFRPIGVGVQKSRNITFDDNVVANIIDRTTVEALQLVDKAGAISVCAYGGNEECPDMFVRNNLVAGSVYGGFVMPGHDCDDTSGRYSGNVAHSMKGIKSGHGLFFQNTPSQTECVQYSDFKAYKCYYQGAFGYPRIKQVVMSNMVMVDNREGFGTYINNRDDEYDAVTTHITIRDSIVYGEHENPDCP